MAQTGVEEPAASPVVGFEEVADEARLFGKPEAETESQEGAISSEEASNEPSETEAEETETLEEGGEAEAEGAEAETQEPESIPYARFKQVIEERDSLNDQLERLAEKMVEVEEREKEYQQVIDWLADLRAAAKFDPKVREFLDHWIVKGGTPSPDEIEDPTAYAEWLADRRSREAERAAQEKELANRLAAQEDEIMARLEEEEKAISKNSALSSFLDENKLADAYEFLADQYAVASRTGREPRIKTLEGAIKALFPDEYSKAVASAEKAKLSKAMKKTPNILPPTKGKAPAAPKITEPWRLPLSEHIRTVISGVE